MRKKIVFSIMLAAVVPVSAMKPDSGDVIKDALEIAGSDVPASVKSEKVQSEYSRFAEKILNADAAGMKTDELSRRFSGLYVFWYFLKEPSLLDTIESSFRELGSRGAATAQQVISMQRVYLESHQFAKAAELADEFPMIRLTSVPAGIGDEDIDRKTLKYYESRPGIQDVRLRSLDIGKGSVLVIYGSPSCHFTREALESMAADDRTAALLPSSILVTPDYDFDGVAQWNKEHALKYKIMYEKKDWSSLRMDFKPGYNFFLDGKQICYSHGWHGEGTVEEVLKCAEKAGFSGLEGRIANAVGVIKRDFSELKELEVNKRAMRLEFSLLRGAGAYSAEKLSGYSPETLSDAYFLAYQFMFYSPVNDGLMEMEAAFSELERRGGATAERTLLMQNAYVKGREFEKAAKLASGHMEYNLPAIPRSGWVNPRKQGVPIVYDVKRSGQLLVPERAKKGGRQILMAGAPGCHASRNALRDIAAAPELAAIFKKRGRLLFAGNDIPSVEEWNKSHNLKYWLADSADWPEMDFSQVPTFYFVEDGRLVHSFSGWPKAGNMDEIFKGLGRLGLLSD